MTVTKASVQLKIDELSKQREQLVAQLNALAGAEQAFKAILAELDESEPKPVAEA